MEEEINRELGKRRAGREGRTAGRHVGDLTSTGQIGLISRSVGIPIRKENSGTQGSFSTPTIPTYSNAEMRRAGGRERRTNTTLEVLEEEAREKLGGGFEQTLDTPRPPNAADIGACRLL